MSYSEAITRADLANILNEVLPQPRGAFVELVWTNPSGDSSKTAVMGESTNITIAKSYTCYDGFMVEFRNYYNDTSRTYDYWIRKDGMTTGTVISSATANPTINYRRWWYAGYTDKTFYFSDCTRYPANSAAVTGSDTGCLVPLRIWGIKFHDDEVSSPSSVDWIVEQGTSGIWEYRKWNSGKAECWGQSRKTRSASNTQFTDSLPFTLDASKHINIQASGAATGNTNAYARYTNAGASSIDVYVYATSGTEVWTNIYVCGTLA